MHNNKGYYNGKALSNFCQHCGILKICILNVDNFPNGNVDKNQKC
jgi:hypothetical protein